MHPDQTRRTIPSSSRSPEAATRFQRRLGLQFLFDYPDIVKAVEFAAENEFGAVELNLGNLDFSRQLANGRMRRRIRCRAEQLQIRLALHAIEGPSLFVPDRAVLRNTLRTAQRLIDRAADTGIENVVMHLGFAMAYSSGGRHEYPHTHYPEFYEALITDALSELKAYARDRVRLCVENVGGFRLEYVRRVLDSLLGENLGLCFDIGHNAILPAAARRAETEFYRHHARQVFHSHLHDNQGTHDEHLELGRGSVKLRPYLEFLITTPALLCLEVRPREAAIRSRNYLVRRILSRL